MVEGYSEFSVMARDELFVGVFKDVEAESGRLGTRLYLVLEGVMSASSSRRRALNSEVATSSRDVGGGA